MLTAVVLRVLLMLALGLAVPLFRRALLPLAPPRLLMLRAR